MSTSDIAGIVGFTLGFVLGWGLHFVALQLAYRMGVVRYVGAAREQKP